MMQMIKTLVIDDEPGMCLVIQKTLQRFTFRCTETGEEIGFLVESTDSAESAIAIINQNRPDLLLLDYKLPGQSGLDLLEQIKYNESDMVVIMMTAYATFETAVTAIKKGAFDFIAKPFEPEELRKTVKKAIQNLILARQIRQLEHEKHQVRFQFISVLGHELKSPINAIEGYLNIMQQRLLGNNIEKYDEMVMRSLARINGMKKLINDLLDLTRIESGQRKREIADHNLTRIAQTAIESIQPQAAEQEITISLQAATEINMLCDASEIEIVLNNLISNAVKYNRRQGSVDVFLNRDGEYVEIKVSDTGIGMTPEETAKLFGEFVRIKNEKTRQITGSGLGLSIVKKIAQLYDGTVNVTSEPDKGSTFTVRLRAPLLSNS